MFNQKDTLYETIEDTVQEFVDNGWVEEVVDPRVEALHKRQDWLGHIVPASVLDQAIDLYNQKAIEQGIKEDDRDPDIEILETAFDGMLKELAESGVINDWVPDMLSK